MDDRLVHVRLNEPNNSRKEILQSTIDIIQLLKGFEKLKLLGREKLIFMSNLKREFKELDSLISKLDSLPKIKIEYDVEEKSKKGVKKIEEKTIRKTSEFDKLEEDINKLRSKINSL